MVPNIPRRCLERVEDGDDIGKGVNEVKDIDYALESHEGRRTTAFKLQTRSSQYL